MHRMTSPRRARSALVITAVSAALVLSGCASGAATAEPSDDELFEMTLQTSWTPNVQFGGSYIADADGMYTAAGLDVTIAPGGPETDPIALVVGGQALIGQSTADSVTRANSEGADLVMLGALFQKNPYAVMSLADNSIDDPAGMVGKRIGVPSGDTATVDALLIANGLEPSDITVVPVGYDIAPLTSGEVDGIVVFYTDQPVALELAGFEGETFLMSDYGLDVYGQTYFTTAENLATYREEITAFLSAEIAGWKAYLDDPDYAAQLTVDDYAADIGLELEAQQIQAARQVELIESDATDEHGILWMSDADIEANLASLARLGITDATAADFDNSLIEEIYAESAQ